MNNEVYVLVALRRKKDKKNEGLDSGCHKVVVKDDDFDFAKNRLMGLCDKGYWRVYRTVNKRDLTKAMKMLQVELVNRGEEIKDKVDSVWKSILMKPQCKAERNFLLDVDDKSVDLNDLLFRYLPNGYLDLVNTPNGYHVVVPPFDSRELLREYGDKVEVKKDALVFMYDLERA